MIYGANGYTGQLVARLAVVRGQRPILAGRHREQVATLADDLGLEHRVFALSKPAEVEAGMTGVAVVAHCAGPFSATAAPMVEACLATGTHYVDITGEIDVFEHVFARDADARRAGVVLLPGAGFDVVPTDCLAAMLAHALPTAVELELAFIARGGASPGTLKTSVDVALKGGRVRVDGRITSVPIGWKARTVSFPSGQRLVTSIPWGDVSTAYRSTGIPTITAYTYIRQRSRFAGLLRWVRPLVRWAVVRGVAGPDAETRERTNSEVWAEVRDAAGRAVSGALTCPNGYSLTADAVVRVVGRIRDVEPGAHTPSTAFGADFVRELDGVIVHALTRAD